MIEAPLITPPEDGKFIPSAHGYFRSSKEYYDRGNAEMRRLGAVEMTPAATDGSRARFCPPRDCWALCVSDSFL